MPARRDHLLPLAVAGAGVALAVASVAMAQRGRRAPAPPAPPLHAVTVQGPSLAHVRPRRPVRPRARPAPPVRIRVDSIGVDARVVGVGLDRAGALEVPSSWVEAGWYTRAPRPGEPGPAVIVGHVDSTSGPAVFYRLGALHRGAGVRISRRDGSVVRFRVQRVERWAKADFPTLRVYGATRRPALRLITCGGAFDSSTGHYVDNTIVFAVRS
jgi:hypothetical protein